jgi:phosphatidylglycerophosphate synthase
MPDPRPFDAIVLADGPAAQAVVVGLTLAERGRRVALRAGAGRVLVVADADARRALAAWWRDACVDAVLVIRASDQVVHTPLVSGLRGASTALAVGAGGAYSGAIFATGDDAAAVIAALGAGEDDRAIAARLAGHAAAVPHGEIACHPAVTRDDRRGAAKLLYRIVHKPQDNAITRYLYRPVSGPLTKLFVRTPITPNQISILTAVIVIVGVVITARGSMNDAILGTAIVLAAAYVDCCDGEVARLKLLSSKLGAWLDTVIDELSSLGYMIAMGIHCHRYWGPDYFGELGFDPWVAGIAVGTVTYLLTMYCIYYNLIVVVGSANSQDYVGRLVVVAGEQPGTVRLAPFEPPPAKQRTGVVKLLAVWLPYLARRDFISWITLFFAIVHVTHFSFALLVAGGVVTSSVVALDHLRLLRQRREIARSGRVLVA